MTGAWGFGLVRAADCRLQIAVDCRSIDVDSDGQILFSANVGQTKLDRKKIKVMQTQTSIFLIRLFTFYSI